jgi:hypothetical protein
VTRSDINRPMEETKVEWSEPTLVLPVSRVFYGSHLGENQARGGGGGGGSPAPAVIMTQEAQLATVAPPPSGTISVCPTLRRPHPRRHDVLARRGGALHPRRHNAGGRRGGGGERGFEEAVEDEDSGRRWRRHELRETAWGAWLSRGGQFGGYHADEDACLRTGILERHGPTARAVLAVLGCGHVAVRITSQRFACYLQREKC